MRPADPVDRIAVIAAALPLFVVGAGGDYEVPDPVHFAVLLAGVAGIAGALTRKRWAGILVLATVLALGAYLRGMAVANRASDVMLTTNEALATLFAGRNPYAHVYAMTNPPGAPLGYPPGELAFYGLAHVLGLDIFRVDLLAGVVGLCLIAYLAPLVGNGLAALAIGTIAAAVDVIFHAVDGSNDTAASFLVLAGIVALAWSLALHGRRSRALWWTSAVAFGWVVAFKEYALPIAVFVALFLWRKDARRARGWIAAATATALAFVLPFFVWNPAAFVSNVVGALFVHPNIWGRNFWHDAIAFIPGAGDVLAPEIPAIMLLAFAGASVLFWRRPAANLGVAFLQGSTLVAIMFLFARWTTSVYYVFLTPLVITGVALMLGAERSPPTRPDQARP